jgi:hypothetical protein
MNKLLKDAIADAKAVRETALANAKVALEEAFAPKLQSMLSHKIKEEMEGKDGEEDETDENKMEVAKMQKMAGLTNEDEDVELERPESDYRNWGEKNMAGKPDDIDEEKEENWADDSDSDSEEDWSGDDDFSDEDGGEEGEKHHHGDDEDGEEVSDDELEEILKELDMEDEDMNPNSKNYRADQDMMDESEDPEHMEMDENDMNMDDEKEMDEEINLDEIIKALKEEEGDEEDGEESKKEEEAEAMKADLDEAYSVIKFLRSKLNEVNLLNAKLLFVNKLFKKGSLSESQKVKIIETFDRAKTVRETKLIYTTLSESMNGGRIAAPKRVKKLNEGLASAPSKSTKKVITESNDVYNRFKSLVNYNNIN